MKYLKRNGINISTKKQIIEVQDWFWYYWGKENGVKFGEVPKLSKTAELFGFSFSEEKDAHSATNDTLMTISILDKILKLNNIQLSENEISKFDKIFEFEKSKDAEQRAKGKILLEETKEGFILKNYAFDTEIEGKYIIIVDSRYIAEHEIRERFKKRELLNKTGVYKLKESDISYFLNYSNKYESTREEILRNIYNSKKTKKKRLNFNII